MLSENHEFDLENLADSAEEAVHLSGKELQDRWLAAISHYELYLIFDWEVETHVMKYAESSHALHRTSTELLAKRIDWP